MPRVAAQLLLLAGAALAQSPRVAVQELDVSSGSVERLGEQIDADALERIYTFVGDVDAAYAVTVELGTEQERASGGELPHGMLTVFADLEGACATDDVACATQLIAPDAKDPDSLRPMYEAFTKLETRDCEDMRDANAALESLRFEKLVGDDRGEHTIAAPGDVAPFNLEAEAGTNYVVTADPLTLNGTQLSMFKQCNMSQLHHGVQAVSAGEILVSVHPLSEERSDTQTRCAAARTCTPISANATLEGCNALLQEDTDGAACAAADGCALQREPIPIGSLQMSGALAESFRIDDLDACDFLEPQTFAVDDGNLAFSFDVHGGTLGWKVISGSCRMDHAVSAKRSAACLNAGEVRPAVVNFLSDSSLKQSELMQTLRPGSCAVDGGERTQVKLEDYEGSDQKDSGGSKHKRKLDVELSICKESGRFDVEFGLSQGKYVGACELEATRGGTMTWQVGGSDAKLGRMWKNKFMDIWHNGERVELLSPRTCIAKAGVAQSVCDTALAADEDGGACLEASSQCIYKVGDPDKASQRIQKGDRIMWQTVQTPSSSESLCLAADTAAFQLDIAHSNGTKLVSTSPTFLDETCDSCDCAPFSCRVPKSESIECAHDPVGLQLVAEDEPAASGGVASQLAWACKESGIHVIHVAAPGGDSGTFALSVAVRQTECRDVEEQCSRLDIDCSSFETLTRCPRSCGSCTLADEDRSVYFNGPNRMCMTLPEAWRHGLHNQSSSQDRCGCHYYGDGFEEKGCETTSCGTVTGDPRWAHRRDKGSLPHVNARRRYVIKVAGVPCQFVPVGDRGDGLISPIGVETCWDFYSCKDYVDAWSAGRADFALNNVCSAYLSEGCAACMQESRLTGGCDDDTCPELETGFGLSGQFDLRIHNLVGAGSSTLSSRTHHNDRRFSVTLPVVGAADFTAFADGAPYRIRVSGACGESHEANGLYSFRVGRRGSFASPTAHGPEKDQQGREKRRMDRAYYAWNTPRWVNNAGWELVAYTRNDKFEHPDPQVTEPEQAVWAIRKGLDRTRADPIWQFVTVSTAHTHEFGVYKQPPLGKSWAMVVTEDATLYDRMAWPSQRLSTQCGERLSARWADEPSSTEAAGDMFALQPPDGLIPGNIGPAMLLELQAETLGGPEAAVGQASTTLALDWTTLVVNTGPCDRPDSNVCIASREATCGASEVVAAVIHYLDTNPVGHVRLLEAATSEPVAQYSGAMLRGGAEAANRTGMDTKFVVAMGGWRMWKHTIKQPPQMILTTTNQLAIESVGAFSYIRVSTTCIPAGIAADIDTGLPTIRRTGCIHPDSPEFDAAAMTSDGSCTCPAAGHYSPFPGACVACGPGSWSDPGSNRCDLCPVGTFASAFGCIDCVDVTGLTCPEAGMLTPKAAPGYYLTYLPNGALTTIVQTTGEAGDRLLPGRLKDSLTSTEWWKLETLGWRGVLCAPVEACEGSSETDAQSSLQRSFSSGYPESICAVGYVGSTAVCIDSDDVMSGVICMRVQDCNKCQKGFYKSGEFCLDCGEPPIPIWQMFVIFVAVMIIVTTLVHKYLLGSIANAHQLTAPVISVVTFLQVVNLVPSFNIRLPRVFKDFLSMLKVFNFSLQFLRPECSVGSWGLFQNQIVALLAPLFIMLFFECVFRVRMLETNLHRSLLNDKEAMAQHRAEGKAHQYHSVTQFFIMMSLFYTKTLLAPFDCSDQGAGPVVDGYSEIKCSMNGAYLKVLIPAGIGLFLYVLMFIHFMWMMYTNVRHHKLDSMQNDLQPGPYRMWPVALLVRKLLISLFAMFTSDNPALGFWASSMVLLVAGIAHAIAQPYKNKWVNAFELSTIFSTMVVYQCAMSLHTECLQDKKCRAAAEGEAIDAGNDWVAQKMESQGSDWMVVVAIVLTLIILVFFVAVEVAVWIEQREEYRVTRAVPKLVARIRISAPAEASGWLAPSSSPSGREVEKVAAESTATDGSKVAAHIGSSELSLAERLLQLQTSLQVKIDGMPVNKLQGDYGVHHITEHDSAKDGLGRTFGVLDPAYGVRSEGSLGDAKAQGSLSMSIGIFRPNDHGEAESIVGDKPGGQDARRHFDDSLVDTLGNLLDISSNLILVEHVRWFIPVYFDLGSWLQSKWEAIHRLLRGEFWQYHTSIAFGIAVMATWAIRRISRTSECLFGQVDNEGLLGVLDDEEWKSQAAEWTAEYCPDTFASGMVAQGRTSFSVAGPLSIMFACCAPPLGMQGMTDMIKTYIMIPVAYLGFIATSILASYTGCWSIRSGCCFCWIPLVRTRCSVCWPCNAWAVTFGLGTFFAITGLLSFPAIWAYKINGFLTHEKFLDPKTHENADKLIFSVLGDDYCGWCTPERITAAKCKCDTEEMLWFMYLIPTGLRYTQAGMLLSVFFMALSRELHYRPRVHPAHRVGHHALDDDRGSEVAPQVVAPTNNEELFECCADKHSLWSKLFSCRIFPEDDAETNPFHPSSGDGGEGGGGAVMPSRPVSAPGGGDAEKDLTEQRFVNPVADDGDDVEETGRSKRGVSPSAPAFGAERE